MAEQIFTPRRGWYDIFRGRSNSCTGQCGAANVLVHRVYSRHCETRSACHERRWHTQMAHGTIAPWCVLERRSESWLSGCGIMDADEINPIGSCTGGVAVCAV